MRNYSKIEISKIINNHSVGCIENGSNSFIEIFIYKGDMLYMDHEDINDDNPFQSLESIHSNYDWDDKEILDQIDDYKDGVTKSALKELLIIKLHTTTLK